LLSAKIAKLKGSQRVQIVRIVACAVLWVGVAAGLTELYGLSSTGTMALVVLAGVGAASLGAGYVVGDWWALVGPVGSVGVLSFLILVYAGNDPGAGFAVVALWFVLGLVCAAVYAGIQMSRTRASGNAPGGSAASTRGRKTN
jgi:hypothetical protein